MERRKRGTGQIAYVDTPGRKLKWKATIVDEKTKKTRNKYFATEKEAKKYLRDINSNEKTRKAILEGGGITFNDFKESFLAEKKLHMKPQPYETLQGTVEIVANEIGNYKLRDIDNTVVQEMINHLSKKGNSTRSKNGYSESVLLKAKNVVTAVLKRACIKGLIDSLPVLDIIIPKQACQDPDKQAKNNYLRDSEIEQYESACVRMYSPKKYTKNYGKELMAHPNGYKLLFLLHTGLRVGEALALTWDDYDEESKTLLINKNVVRTSEGKITQNSPKTESGERVIILNRNALADIHNLKKQFEEQTKEIEAKMEQELEEAAGGHSGQDLKAKRKEIKERYRRLLDNHRYIFPATTFPYGMAGKDSTNQTHNKICKEIGLTHNVTVHGLRHTYVTHYYIHHCNDKDFDLATFSRSIGHSSIRTTMEIYAHLEMTEQRFIMRTAEDLKEF